MVVDGPKNDLVAFIRVTLDERARTHHQRGTGLTDGLLAVHADHYALRERPDRCPVY